MQGKIVKSRLGVVGLGLMAAVAHADHETHQRSLSRSPITPFVSGALHIGGDTLATTSNGNVESDLDAGSGIAARIGVNFAVSPHIELEGSFGIKYNRIDADDGNASILSFPVDGLVFARFNQHRIGGGVALHLAPEYEIDSSSGSGIVEFDDAVGYIIQYDFLPTAGGVRFGLRYTGIEYETDFDDFDASNFAIFAAFYF